jgi:uncharacterized protein (TIGR00299 family) protein
VDVAVTTLNDRARKMDTLYFDCFNGAGGDMIVAALLDAGVDAARLEHDLGLLGVEGYRLAIEKIQKQGFAATRFLVNAETDGQPHRHLRDIRAILDASRLPERVRARATTAFERLANAEARAHGVALEAVHFHEVGAIDAIVDVVSAMLALEQLQPRRVLCSPLPVGSGTVQCAHGTMPVPAPATALLLTGVPIAATEETGELLTPTAAAILTTVCDSFGALPAMTISAVGMGAGTRDGVHRPNLLRVLGGTATEADAASAESDTVTVLAANIDDTPGEWTGYCLTRLLEAGARDAYCVPISMKKQRPGVVLTVICDSADVARLGSDHVRGDFDVRHSSLRRPTQQVGPRTRDRGHAFRRDSGQARASRGHARAGRARVRRLRSSRSGPRSGFAAGDGRRSASVVGAVRGLSESQ